MCLEDYKTDVYACIHCGECKLGPRSQMPICPSGEASGFNTTYSCGFLDLARSLLEGKAEWNDPGVLNAVYSCLACGACFERCYPQLAIRTTEVFRALKAEFVERGFGPPPKASEMLRSLAHTGNFFGQPRSRIMGWAEGLNVRQAAAGTEVIFFVGCYEAFDPERAFIARAAASLLNKCGSDWGVLGECEVCCGFPALELGCRKEFGELATENIEKISALRPKLVVTACACCYGVMGQEWSRVGALDFEVLHISQFLLRMVREGRLRVKAKVNERVTFHDPCHLGRRGGSVYEPPRELLKAIPGLELREMERSREESWCCGAGGCVNVCFPDTASSTAAARLAEAAQTGASSMVVPSCPICYSNFAALSPGGRKIELRDLCEMLDKVT